MNFNFVDRSWKNLKMSNFMKIPAARAELFHADRRKDAQT